MQKSPSRPASPSAAPEAAASAAPTIKPQSASVAAPAAAVTAAAAATSATTVATPTPAPATTTTAAAAAAPAKLDTKGYIDLEHDYSAHNYHPLPVVWAAASGATVTDVEGNKFIDALSAYGATNQGHCHPRIVKALVDQASKLTLSSRAFHNDQFGPFAKYVTEYFGYEMVLPMNTGAEAVETAIKLARKWGYIKKGIPDGAAVVLACSGNFHGRTTGVISMSTDPDARRDFGPYLPNVGPFCPATGREIRYGVIEDLEAALIANSPNVAGFLVEPIQGEAGIVIPPPGYMKKAYELCQKHNVLFIADEIQTGLGRAGTLLAIEHEDVHPDVVLLGKALSGGLYPVSAVLSSKEIMLTIQPGEHGSTYGGNPLACAVATEALKVLKEENMCQNARRLEEVFRAGLLSIKSPAISEIRGRGLMFAIVIDENATGGKTAWDLCLKLRDQGLLAKPTHDTIIRLTPPLCITERELKIMVEMIRNAINEVMIGADERRAQMAAAAPPALPPHPTDAQVAAADSKVQIATTGIAAMGLDNGTTTTTTTTTTTSSDAPPAYPGNENAVPAGDQKQ
ncbi:ornithine aminotransferase [Ramicandelaber brevisporus]|nr:ornithine aminotransferase [Ramicandelaber brevisporus]